MQRYYIKIISGQLFNLRHPEDWLNLAQKRLKSKEQHLIFNNIYFYLVEQYFISHSIVN